MQTAPSARIHPIYNLRAWIEENRHLLKPPVGNKVVYQETDDFIVMVVGGPNSRTDYHYNETEEFFYMVEGDMTLRVQDGGQAVDIPIREGEIFLLPGRVPHSPQRKAGTVGIVIERKRTPEHTDGLLWFCPECNHKLYEEYFPMQNIMTQMQEVFERVYANEEIRTCNNCGHVLQPPVK
jgi:3-hydroxyanthranilate 3,4-dioxygenase